MDNEQAKFLLSAARADGSDASDPRIAEALEQARRDPELARWLAEERAFDAAVVRKLERREPPSHLRARLLAGAHASAGRTAPRTSIARRFGGWIGAAAAIALLSTGVALWWRGHPESAPSRVVARPPLLEWQESCLGIFNDPDFALDLMSEEYAPLERHLVENDTRILPTVPFVPRSVGFVGCKVLAWRGQPVSFLCLRASTGELVHLFVVPRGVADETQVTAGLHRTTVGEFATVSWRQGDLIAMAASKMPQPQLDAILAPAVAQGTRAPQQFARR